MILEIIFAGLIAVTAVQDSADETVSEQEDIETVGVPVEDQAESGHPHDESGQEDGDNTQIEYQPSSEPTAIIEPDSADLTNDPVQPVSEGEVQPVIYNVQIQPDGNSEPGNQNRDRQQANENALVDIARSDVLAQWGMTVIAGLALVLTAYGIFLLYRTLEEARKTTNAAIKSVESSDKAVKAAEATVRATREIGNRQLRPYIGPSDPKVVRDGEFI